MKDEFKALLKGHRVYERSGRAKVKKKKKLAPNPFGLYNTPGRMDLQRKLMKATKELADYYMESHGYWSQGLLRKVGEVIASDASPEGHKHGITDTASRECWYAVLLKLIGREGDWTFCNNGMPDLFNDAQDFYRNHPGG